MTFLQFLPFLILVVLANFAERQNVLKYIVYGLLILLDGACLLLSVFAAVMHLAMPYMEEATGIPMEVFARMDLIGLALTLFGMGVAGLVILLPPVRRWFARFLPLNPASPLHSTALSFAIYYVGVSVAQIQLAGGLEGLAELSLETSPLEMLLSGLSLALFGILGAGLWVRRKPSETAQRLGLTLPTWRQVGLAAGAIAGFLALDLGVSWAWHALDPEGYRFITGVGLGIFGELTVAKAAAIGLSAGFGEEILFRGAVQPRFGLWVTAVLFAAGHTQYGLSPAFFEVLLIGVVLGLIRKKANTTTCIAIHTLYNFLDILLVPLFP